MTMKMPKSIGACIDLLYETRQKRLDGQKAVDAVALQEREIEDHILKQFEKVELSGAKGGIAQVSIKQTVVYNISDWDAVFSYATKHNAPDLLQKRLSSTAIRDRLDNGEEIPGIESFTKIGLSLTKVSAK